MLTMDGSYENIDFKIWSRNRKEIHVNIWQENVTNWLIIVIMIWLKKN